MDDTTRKMMATIGAGIAKKLLIGAGMSLATHGVISSNQTETFVAVGMALVGAAWSFWNDYGRAIVLSQLEVLKAKSLAQADQARSAGLPPLSMGDIAAKSPTLMPTDVAKVVAKLPNAASVILLAFALSALLASAPAHAQTRQSQPKTLNLPLDPLHLNGTQVTGDVSKDMQALWQKIVAASNSDLQYASALAGASGTNGGKVRKQCWDAIVALNEQANGANLKNPDGTPMARPDPHLFTDVETLAEVIDNLSPQGPLFTSCAGAAELAKTNVFNFIAAAIGGAAGLAAMPIVPGL